MSVVALDIGSSNIKAILARWDGQILDVHSVRTPLQSALPGERSYPVAAVNSAAEALVAGIASTHRDDPIDTMVFSCLGTAMAPVDQAERPLGPALSPADTRPADGPGLETSLDLAPERLRHMTGSDPYVASFLLQSLWWRRSHPEVMDRLHRFRSLRGFIVQQLSGADAEDRSWASRTMLLDLEQPDTWSQTILAAAGLPVEVLPEIHSPTATWEVGAAAGARFGLAPGARLVLGGMDNCCSLFGATDPSDPRLAVIVGTYEHVAGSGELDLARDAAAAAGGVVHTYLLPGRYLSMTRKPLGLLLSQVAEAGEVALDALLDAVSERPLGATVGLDPESVRSALETGMAPSVVVQALLESAAMVLKRFADRWSETGHQTEHLAVVGGGSSRANVLQLKADLLGRSLSTLTFDEGAGFGALRLAAMAVQDVSAAEACELFPNRVLSTWAPQPT